jgi:hypothetical protein
MFLQATKQLTGHRCARWSASLPGLLAGEGVPLLSVLSSAHGIRNTLSHNVCLGTRLYLDSPAAQDASHKRPGSTQASRLYASAHPEVTVYPGPQSPRKAVTLRTLRAKYEKGQPITMVTAYDYPSAVHVSQAAATAAAAAAERVLSMARAPPRPATTGNQCTGWTTCAGAARAAGTVDCSMQNAQPWQQ